MIGSWMHDGPIEALRGRCRASGRPIIRFDVAVDPLHQTRNPSPLA